MFLYEWLFVGECLCVLVFVYMQGVSLYLCLSVFVKVLSSS